jgi:hypothetical protein
MTRDRDLDSILDEWFADGPARVADRVIDDALRTIDHTRQARGGLRLARYAQMNGTLRLVAVAVAALVVVAIGAGLIVRYSPAQIGAPTVTPTVSASPSATTSPSPSASPAVGILVEGASVFPGTYRSNFDPPLTLTVGNQVENGCAPGFQCRGTVDANQAAWLNIEFGNAPPDHPRIEVFAVRLDKVFDVAHPGKLVNPPADLATWFTRLPGVKVLAQPKPVTIGGLPGTQLDLQAGSKGVAFGPIPGVTDPGAGMGKGQTIRLFIVPVNGRDVVIWVAADEVGTSHFATMTQTMQPLIDSIVWH